MMKQVNNKVSLLVLLVVVGMSLSMQMVQGYGGTTDTAESVVYLPSGGGVRGIVFPMSREFYGIPYAVPPVGPLRFQPPQMAAPFPSGTIFNATSYGYGCPQRCDLPPMTCPIDSTSEDCLTLQVFTPRLANITSPRPVMVFFYGGNYRQGASETPLYNGYYLSNHSGAIVVVPNYRLGALAFFKNKDLVGNLAIQDQTLVLSWIQKNIAAFGGDANRVTIFGQSAGGSSVACHMVSPASRGLFHGAIMESNPITLWLKTPAENDALSYEFARYLGCQQSNTSCVMSKTAEEIVNAEEAVVFINPLSPLQVFMPWQPTADGTYISGQPMLQFPLGNYNRVPFLLGNVDQEGLLFIYTAIPKPLPPHEYREILNFVFQSDAEKVWNMYPVYPSALDARPQMSILGTDYIWACPHRNISRYMSNYAPLYLYHFDHAMSFDPWGPEYAECAGHICHGSELPFLFNAPPLTPIFGLNYEFTDDEKVLSALLSGQFGNFATSFNPNVGDVQMPSNSTWPAYSTANDIRWLYRTPVSTTETGYRKYQCDFFDTIGYTHGNTLFNAIARAGAKYTQ